MGHLGTVGNALADVPGDFLINVDSDVAYYVVKKLNVSI